MICVTVTETLDGQFVSVVQPQPATFASCAYVLTTPGEQSPWVMSQEQAAQIAVEIGLLWGFAFVIRSFIRFIQYTR